MNCSFLAFHGPIIVRVSGGQQTKVMATKATTPMSVGWYAYLCMTCLTPFCSYTTLGSHHCCLFGQGPSCLVSLLALVSSVTAVSW